jgi:hypothetical protein
MQETKEWLQHIFESEYILEATIHSAEGCLDCGCPVTLEMKVDKDGTLNTKGGSLMKKAGIDKPFFKCEACHEKNPRWTDFQPCEIYTRVVGYLRPVQQFNPGAKASYKKRVTFEAEKF